MRLNNHNNIKSFIINSGNSEIVVTRKRVKYLRLSVSPLDGSVKVSSPFGTRRRDIEDFVISKTAWITKHQKKFQDRALPAPFLYESGESHYFKGKLYKLEIRYEDKKSSVFMDTHTIVLCVRPGSTMTKRKKILNEFYRDYLKQEIPVLIKKWAPVIGDSPLDWGVKNMKTRWGSCNIRAKRIWLSLKIAEKSVSCLEYVVVHEMVHLLEGGHGHPFKAQMDRVLPDWRSIRSHLNNSY